MKKFLPIHCLLCGEKTTGEVVCALCDADCAKNPPACPLCAMPSFQAQLCHICLHAPPEMATTTALFAYEFPTQHLIVLMKYRENLALIQWFAKKLSAKIPKNAVIIPIPLAPNRLKMRGFNQSLLLARAVQKILPNVEIAQNLLFHAKMAQNQTGLSQKERIKNIRGAFFVQNPKTFENRPIFLLDDVMTTGATLNEAARTLKAANIAPINAIVLARRF